jgi:hypothetical protein
VRRGERREKGGRQQKPTRLFSLIFCPGKNDFDQHTPNERKARPLFPHGTKKDQVLAVV